MDRYSFVHTGLESLYGPHKIIYFLVKVQPFFNKQFPYGLKFNLNLNMADLKLSFKRRKKSLLLYSKF